MSISGDVPAPSRPASASRGMWALPVWGKKHHLFWDNADHGDWSRCGRAVIDTKRRIEAADRKAQGIKITRGECCKNCQRPETVTINFRPSV